MTAHALRSQRPKAAAYTQRGRPADAKRLNEQHARRRRLVGVWCNAPNKQAAAESTVGGWTVGLVPRTRPLLAQPITTYL